MKYLKNQMNIVALGDHYNKIYSENKTAFGGGNPEKIVRNIMKYRSSGTVLELGAGEGRNSLFLAENGFKVTAQDLSHVGLDKLNKIAKEKDLEIKTEIKDISATDLERTYDVFICTYVLHHLQIKTAFDLIKQMQQHTNPSGLNVITVFTQNGDFYRNKPDTENFYPKEGELKELYDTWEVLEYAEMENKALQKNQDGSPMKNVAAKLLARKRE